MATRKRKLDIDYKSAVAFTLREITHICRDMKKHAPGSDGEREAAKYMAASLKKDCGCRDSYDNLNEEGLTNCIRATAAFIEALEA